MTREVKAGGEQVTTGIKEGDGGGSSCARMCFELISEENRMHKCDHTIQLYTHRSAWMCVCVCVRINWPALFSDSC